MRTFDYSFLKSMPIPATLMETALGMGEMKERNRIRLSQNQDIASSLEKIAKMQSVKTSNAIEGIATSDKRIRSIMERSVEPSGHDEQEIAGYRDVLELIHSEHGRLELDETTLRTMHSMLMSYTARGGGSYKESNNVIIAINKDGTREVRFRPMSAADTPKAMEQLMLALTDAWQDSGINRLLLIPCFILDFLSVHPFPDGNGRMSRLLTLLLYYNSGIDVGKYVSFEAKIEASRHEYYDVLQESSYGWETGRNDYMPFIKYYLDTLFLCYRDLDSRFNLLNGKKPTKTHRIEAVVLNSILPISKKDIITLLPDVSETTVESVLRRMLDDGEIVKIGNNKGARYRRK